MSNPKDGFIKNHDLLKEDCHVEDLLDFSVPISKFKKRLDSISKPSVVGLIGKFGSGKSTMLYQLIKAKQDDEIWIEFDAWKYPDRKDLWEGFILDFAEQVSYKKEVLAKIDGKDGKSKVIDVVGGISKSIPGFGFIDEFGKLLRSSPATRVFQLQDILRELIYYLDKDIYIIVEDIDRSGDAGVYFLETLNQFIKSINESIKIIAIAPIGSSKFRKNIESYLKCLDYVEQFDPKNIGFDKFVNAIFKEECFEGNEHNSDNSLSWQGSVKRGQISTFFKALVQKNEDITIRLIKTILRQSEQKYISQFEDGYSPDWRITIGFEASRSLYKDPNKTLYEHIRETSSIIHTSIIAIYFHILISNHGDLFDKSEPSNGSKLHHSPYHIELTTRSNRDTISGKPSWPWKVDQGYRDPRKNGEVNAYVCDFYLDY